MGNLDCEIIQLSAISDDTGETINSYIIPQGKISAEHARFSHKLRFVKDRYYRGSDKESFKPVNFEEAAKSFIQF